MKENIINGHLTSIIGTPDIGVEHFSGKFIGTQHLWGFKH